MVWNTEETGDKYTTYFFDSSQEASSSILMVLFASTEAQKTLRVWTPLSPEHSEEHTLHCVANQENSQTCLNK